MEKFSFDENEFQQYVLKIDNLHKDLTDEEANRFKKQISKPLFIFMNIFIVACLTAIFLIFIPDLRIFSQSGTVELSEVIIVGLFLLILYGFYYTSYKESR